jgi:type II secretory pathway component PulM
MAMTTKRPTGMRLSTTLMARFMEQLILLYDRIWVVIIIVYTSFCRPWFTRINEEEVDGYD